MVLAVAAGCKDDATTKAVEKPPIGSAAPAIVEDSTEALSARFEQLLLDGKDADSIPAGKKLVDALRTKQPASHAFATALTKYGMQLQVTGDWQQSRVVLEEALAHPEAAKDHALLAEIKFQLGALYTELRETDKAIAILRSAIDLVIETNGPDAINVAIYKESLASAYDYAEQYAQAEPLFREVLAIYEKGDDAIRVGRALTNLAVNLEFQDRHAEALKLYLRGVEKLSKAEGYERSGLAEAHSGVGRMHQSEKQYPQAIASFRKALAIRIEVLGPEHPLVGMDYHNLALALRDGKQRREARAACAKALAIRQVKLPADHPYRMGTESLCAELAK